ncbi:snodprot1 [Coprinopsis cinerea okayama7|uniref:Snodprot1 n=1 Tax=Coprinopsis cinerea (strain Okayama-7 / 130 / ATCC MYA-4618 / FGSC 9003) TaxID=240176 RepID=A8PGF6_COPC7|nr:snodprot1 [Coprinopsis cinerea okayama7\|eukprot:XP_001841206.2 snodprot1 [Coprinopsis cinerea okayama7\
MLTKLVLVISAAVTAALAGPPLVTTIRYDGAYCNAGASLHTTACSTGSNGLITKGYSTFGSLPTFPRIAGSILVEGWNSTNCGGCYELYYEPTNGAGGRSIYVTAVNSAPEGFVLCTDTFLDFTEEEMGTVPESITVEARAVPAYDCGFE